MNIRLIISWCVLSLASAAAQAQIKVEVQVPEQYYLPGEAVVVGLKITNFSGQTLKMATVPDWVEIAVESSENYIVPERKEVSVPGEFEIETGNVATRRFDIAPFFDLTRPGHYTLRVSVRIPQWGQTYASKPEALDVLPGYTLWEQQFGVPPEDPSKPQPPDVRKYTLIKTTRENKSYLYVSVTDPGETHIYGVLRLTQMVSFSRPEYLLDNQNNLHVFCQNGRIAFNYSVIDPDGNLIKRQTWRYAGQARPNLSYDSEGNVEVVDASRVLRADDFPPQEQKAPEEKVTHTALPAEESDKAVSNHPE